MSAVSYQVFFNKSCNAVNGRVRSSDTPVRSSLFAVNRRVAAGLRRTANRDERQSQQQFFLGQIAQAHQAFICRVELALRILRARRRAVRKFNLAAAGGGVREALQTTLAYQLRTRLDRDGGACAA